MTTINAQTIINEVMDAYAVAPSEHNEHQNNYACYWPKFAPWGFEDLNESTSEYPTSAENAYRDLIYDLMTDATSEINDLFMVPTKIKFQTSERGFHTVRNIKANLKNFADLVRKNASAFGGGLIKAQKQRAAVSWPAQSIALFKQSIEEHDYRAALDIGEKLGALFFVDNKGAAQMQVAPVPCDFESRLSSVCNEDGTYAVIFPQNMTSLSGSSVRAKRSRAAQIENVQKSLNARTNFNLSEALDKQSYSPVDQVATRAQWILEHGLDAEVIETRIVAHESESIEQQAAQDVAHVVAQAVATIAISEAMQPGEAGELVTCEAGESEASAPTASQTSWAPTPQYVPPSLSQIKPGAPVPPAYRGGMDDTDPPSDGNAEPTPAPMESTEDAPELDLKGFTKTDDANGFYLKDGNLTVNVSMTLTGFQAQFMSGKSVPRLTAQDAVDWADALRAESARIAKLTPATPSVQKQADTPAMESQPDTPVMGTEAPAYGEGLETWEMDALTFSKQSRDNPHWTQSYPSGEGDYLRDCFATHARIVAEHEAKQAQDVPTVNANEWGPAIGERYIGAVEYAVQEANKRGDGFEYRTGENALMERRKLSAVTHASECPPSQSVKSKSEKWAALLFMDAGLFVMVFNLPNKPGHTQRFNTASERMAALQAMARAADAPTDTPPGGGLPRPEPVAAPEPVASVAPTPTVAVSSASPTPPVAVRRNFIPDNGLHIVDDAFEAWTFPWEDRFSFVMYLGKSAKPWKMFSYSTEAKRDDGFNRYATDARAIALSKADRKAQSKAQADKPHGLQVGDVVRSSWGYEQTNVNHYQIVKVIGKRTVEVRALAVHEEATGGMTGRVAPVHGEFVGEVMRRTVDARGDVNMLSASYGRASKIEPLAIVHGVRCYAASGYSSHA